MEEAYGVVVGAGTLRAAEDVLFTSPHRWTDGGVTVQGAFTGAHLLHVAVGGCVLNDAYREAEVLGVRLDGVRVTVRGGFDPQRWASTGIEYRVELDPPAPSAALARLLERVEQVAEIPKALAAGAVVRRLA